MTKTNNIEGERERIEALLTFQWHFVQKKSEGEWNEWVTFAFVELRLKLDPRRTTDTRFNLMQINDGRTNADEVRVERPTSLP